MHLNLRQLAAAICRLLLQCIPIVAALALVLVDASAQSWPAKPIKIIVPVPPGQGADIITRLVAERLAMALGQPVVVDNKPGAGTMVGSEAAAKSAPDGYTILAAGSSALAINPHLYAKTSYNPLKDFTPITQLVSIDFVLCVHPSLPVNSVRDLIRVARERPDGLTYGSTGNGTTNHLAMALLASANSVKVTHVPYKGSVPAMTDLVGGQISMIAESVAVVMPHLRSSRIRPIGVMSLKRSPILPEIPTLDEQGQSGFAVSTWTGLVAPAGTPSSILDRLNAETVKIIRMPDIQSRVRDLGMVAIGDSREQFGTYIHAEYLKWASAVKASGVRVE